MTAHGWFTRRTFHHSRFQDLGALVEAKRRAGRAVSACIPTLNEEATIGPIVASIRTELMEDLPLVDELVVMDSLSDDRTAQVAEAEGATVVQDRDVLPALDPASGKGEALWKSLLVLKGDLIVWLDGDIEEFHPRFVYGPLAPMLLDEGIGYVKAFYDRPMRRGDTALPAEGGRVTELLARPLLNMFWPELSAVVQPLSGEYAGRRDVLERIPFFTGYGVELGMLIDVYEAFGMDAIAQVDLDVRLHRNQSLQSLSRMSFAILQTALRRLVSTGRIHPASELETVYRQLRKEGEEYTLEASEVQVVERPPVISVPEYASR